MTAFKPNSLTHQLFLPTLLFAALGGMTWAVRGSSGFGAMKGCLFAGLTWGTAWWYLSRDPSGTQRRPYASGWVILALTLGIGYAGSRGWMQWSNFFVGELQINASRGESVPIARIHGFIWLFIAGVPWAGLGACCLAWCSTQRSTPWLHWMARIGCGLGLGWLAAFVFDRNPQIFLPLYESIQPQYLDLKSNPNLGRLIGDNRLAIIHLGLMFGFLVFEVIRRDWRNVTLILTVGLVNGIGWSLLQNWKWALKFWPGEPFNFWRCWESSGGISIGIALGVAFYLVNRPLQPSTPPPPPNPRPNLERFGTYAGLVIGLGLSIKNGIRGWANLYVGYEGLWEIMLWRIIGPTMLVILVLLAIRIRKTPVVPGSTTDLFPHAYRLLWMVLIVQNVIAQMVTGPHTIWSETAFSIYYGLLFLITTVTVIHHRAIKSYPCH